MCCCRQGATHLAETRWGRGAHGFLLMVARINWTTFPISTIANTNVQESSAFHVEEARFASIRNNILTASSAKVGDELCASEKGRPSSPEDWLCTTMTRLVRNTCDNVIPKAFLDSHGLISRVSLNITCVPLQSRPKIVKKHV